ncbi:hypothetical protein SMICM17S_02714 [Streptomyces microflavus]
MADGVSMALPARGQVTLRLPVPSWHVRRPADRQRPPLPLPRRSSRRFGGERRGRRWGAAAFRVCGLPSGSVSAGQSTVPEVLAEKAEAENGCDSARRSPGSRSCALTAVGSRYVPVHVDVHFRYCRWRRRVRAALIRAGCARDGRGNVSPLFYRRTGSAAHRPALGGAWLLFARVAECLDADLIGGHGTRPDAHRRARRGDDAPGGASPPAEPRPAAEVPAPLHRRGERGLLLVGLFSLRSRNQVRLSDAFLGALGGVVGTG